MLVKNKAQFLRFMASAFLRTLLSSVLSQFLLLPHAGKRPSPPLD